MYELESMSMERVIITTTEYGKVILPDIPNENVWMSEPELVELFGVIAPTLLSEPCIKAVS